MEKELDIRQDTARKGAVMEEITLTMDEEVLNRFEALCKERDFTPEQWLCAADCMVAHPEEAKAFLKQNQE